MIVDFVMSLFVMLMDWLICILDLLSLWRVNGIGCRLFWVSIGFFIFVFMDCWSCILIVVGSLGILFCVDFGVMMC